MGVEENRDVVEQLWRALYRRDFDAVGAHFHADGTYTDVPTPPDDVAVGPTQIAARLELGLGPLDRIDHDIGCIVAEGDRVVTEHVETWHWPTGESVPLPFVSVHELREGASPAGPTTGTCRRCWAPRRSGGSITSCRAGPERAERQRPNSPA